MSGRTDSASRIIAAEPPRIYAALIDPEAMVEWRPPTGMRGEVLGFDPRPGGTLRMALHYEDRSVPGKSGDGSDVFESRFVALDPGRRVTEAIDFSSNDPAFSGTMTMTTSLVSSDAGTEVTITCTGVPTGISPEDHAIGLASTLDNLALYCEARS
ncbi:SRPBCC domain-containing protein [Pelagibacterium montanilacus]|uniref:SRPBCC domain-containing protein n=1 Tax=Pelagibacterium montanilacus TaxID=2185280 RepID=UPI000F8D16D2|nr:SRPBCC domain-containing protein [Pelagibacterium montanilacus]